MSVLHWKVIYFVLLQHLVYCTFLRCSNYKQWKRNTWTIKIPFDTAVVYVPFSVTYQVVVGECTRKPLLWKQPTVVDCAWLSSSPRTLVLVLHRRSEAQALSVRGLLDWFTCLDFNGLYNRFPNVPPVGSGFRGLKWSHRAIRFGQRKLGICFRHVGVWTLLCSCINTIGQLPIIRFHVLLQRKMFSFQFSKALNLTFPGS